MTRWLRRVRLLVRRDAVERAMDAEMRHHIECETADRIAGGMPPEEARLSALRDFGGLERYKEDGRDTRGTRLLEDLGRDLRYAGRVLRRNPGYTALISLTFALGIGATTSMFSVVYGVLLRPLPYRAPQGLVALWERNIQRNRDRNVVSLENFEAWRKRAASLGGMSALMPRSITLPGEPLPERIPGAEVSAGYFGLLGVPPALGRDFAPGESAVVILSDGLWRRRFGADPGVVGRQLAIEGTGYTVVGVMPSGFDPPRLGWLGEQQVWFPFVVTEQARSWGRFLIVLARLKPGVSVESAEAELVSVARVLEQTSATNRGWSASVVGLREQISGDARTELVAVLVAAGLLLVLAVTNVAMLTLSMMRRREHEMAVRRAIGASEGRLVRQLFVQGALLGAIGTAVGLLTAIPALKLLRLLLPPDFPRTASIALDAPVWVTSSLVATIATALFGWLAALRGRAPGESLARLAAPARAGRRTGGGALVAVEIALGLALAVAALLTARSFAGLRSVDLGFDPGGVVAARVPLSEDYETPERQRAFFEAVAERFAAVPGVVAAGIVSIRPFGGLGAATTVSDATKPLPAPGDPAPVADGRYANPAFFAAMRMRFVEGGPFANDARPESPIQGVINETLARSLWPGERAVGKRLHVAFFKGIVAEVTGVVRDVHLMDSRTPPRPVVFLPAARFPSSTMDVMVRVDGDPAAIVPSLRSALASLDPALPLSRVATMPEIVETALAEDRFATVLMTGFAVAALLLAGVGIFGVFAGDVASRRREIGIRLALGGTNRAILAAFLRRSLRQASIGIAVGSGLGLALSHSMASMLFGISPADPATFLAGAAFVGLLAAGATVLPAWQALKRAPLSALREE